MLRIGLFELLVIIILVFAVVLFFWRNRRTRKIQDARARSIGKAEDAYTNVLVVLIFSGIIILVLPVLSDKFPLYTSIEGLLQLALCYFIWTRRLWSIKVLHVYAVLATMVMLSEPTFAWIEVNSARDWEYILPPAPGTVGLVFGLFVAWTAIVKGSRAFRILIAEKHRSDLHFNSS